MRVYVITSFDRSSFVRSVVHPDLIELGATPTSAWAECAAARKGPERLDIIDRRELSTAYHANRIACTSADLVLALLDEKQPRQGFCEILYALDAQVPVIVLGRHCLETKYHAEFTGLAVQVATYADGLIEIRKRVVARLARVGTVDVTTTPSAR